MPVWTTLIVPALVMPPPELLPTKTGACALVAKTSMPNPPEIVPELMIEPVMVSPAFASWL